MSDSTVIFLFGFADNLSSYMEGTFDHECKISAAMKGSDTEMFVICLVSLYTTSNSERKRVLSI